jgi:hypothetical protein
MILPAREERRGQDDGWGKHFFYDPQGFLGKTNPTERSYNTRNPFLKMGTLKT